MEEERKRGSTSFIQLGNINFFTRLESSIANKSQKRVEARKRKYGKSHAKVKQLRRVQHRVDDDLKFVSLSWHPYLCVCHVCVLFLECKKTRRKEITEGEEEKEKRTGRIEDKERRGQGDKRTRR
jgi:hypothetical protein